MKAIYARKSLDRPDSVSIDAQVQQCRQVIQGEAEIYADQGYSGKNTRRPDFERLITDIKSGKITTVVSYRLDRVSRNIIDFANLLNMFEKYNVEYISATEQFDTSTPMGRAMIYIVMVFAQLERETIASRILDNYRFRSARGLFMGGNTPFGYDSCHKLLDGKRISILEPNSQSEVLQRMFDKLSSRDSLVSICHELNREGIKTSKGNLWSSNAVKRVLQNISPCCADENLYDYLMAAGYNIANVREDFDGQHGMCLFFKNKDRNKSTDVSDQTAVVGLHNPLISSEQFIHVQQILNMNVPVCGKRSERSFLAGLIKCKECGHSFGIKYTFKGGREYTYYRCRGRESRGVCSNKIYLSAEVVENSIVHRCYNYLKKLSFDETKITPKEEYRPSTEVEQLKGQIQNLIDNIGKGNAVVDDLLTQKITALQSQIDAISSKVRSPEPSTEISEKTVMWLTKQIEHFEALEINQKIDVIRSIIKTIIIDVDGNIEIEYLF